jgi:rhomboid protease GluP
MELFSRSKISLSLGILYGIIAINVVIWLLLQFPSAAGTEGYTISDRIFFEGAKINSQIRLGEVWRLLTAGFLHQEVFHIFSNMYSLYVLWQLLMKFVKPLPLLGVYLGAIIGGTTASYFLSSSISIGASGGVFGLLGLALVVAYRLNQWNMMKSLAQVVMINAVIGILGSRFIDNWAHLGGFVSGIALGWIATLAIKQQLTNSVR